MEINGTTILTDEAIRSLLLEQRNNAVPTVVIATVSIQAFIVLVGIIANFIVIVVTAVGRDKQVNSLFHVFMVCTY